MELLVWHDQPAVKTHGLELSSVGFWLNSDTSKDLPDSFSLLINARALGVQVGSVSIAPFKNGPFSMPLIAQIGGSVNGRIDDWTAFDAGGKPVDADKDPKWSTATSIGFTVTGIADVTIASNVISTIIPLGWLAKAALAMFGGKIKISVAHEHVTQQLPHGAAHP